MESCSTVECTQRGIHLSQKWSKVMAEYTENLIEHKLVRIE